MNRPARVDLYHRWFLARLVVTDGFDDSSIAWASGIGHDNSVRRLLLLADAHQPDPDHALPYFVQMWGTSA
jgi:hypothetical protein